MLTGTKKGIIDLIKRRGILSIDEAVDEIELAKTTLREHFLQLENDGYVEREFIRSGPGRPSLQFQLTPKGNSLFPSSESALIREIIKYLKSKGDEETIEEFFELFWDERFNKAQGRIKESSVDNIESKLSALMKMLEEEGFMPEFELNMKKETLRIKECNCPFSEVVKETRLPCKLEADFYKKLFNSTVERVSYIPDGDHCCSYSIASGEDL